MQPIKLLNALKSDMIDYITSKYPFLERGRDDLNKQLIGLMTKDRALFQDPVIQLVRGRKSVSSNTVDFVEPLKKILRERLPTPYTHQLKAWMRIQNNLPTVISTGTGSGKSECFMFPMIDGLVRSGFGSTQGKLGAICIYPMNALVEDQFFRLLSLTEGTGLKVGIYNGTYKSLSAASKAKILDRAREANKFIDMDSFFVDPANPESYPHILLTNYKMLEYMLLRTSDQRLFQNVDLKYLVLDEAHSYTGTLGLEISCLLARLRVHLGASAENFVPIATSATLSQGSASLTQDEAIEARTKHRASMGDFFTQLFNKSFSTDSDTGEWLIEDDFVELPKADITVFKDLIKVPAKDLEAALSLPFPEGLAEVAKTLLGIELSSGNESHNDPHQYYEKWASLLYPRMSQIASQLARIVLLDPISGREDRVVSYRIAEERFVNATKGTRAHLDALLILASQAFEKSVFPALGLRIHSFTRSEPRVYWTLDGKTLLDESGMESETRPVGAFVSCRKCGHMAWAGLYTPTSGPGDHGSFQRLPTFYEDAKLADGQEVIVLHRPEDAQDDVISRKDWSVENVKIDPASSSNELRFIIKDKNKDTPPIKADTFIRIKRKADGEWTDDDMRQCPSCGATASKNEPPVLLTPRSGAATDISVYSASLMTNLDIAEERKLLVFCDNRQETAFLAGFLTDRHRRFNLRRAIATFLKESAAHDVHKWKLLQEIDPDEQPKGHRYDFAARIILSIQNKKYFGNGPLPARLQVDKRKLTEIIPRDILEVDFIDRKDPDNDQNNDWKNWLLGNISISQSSRTQSDGAELNSVELFDTDRGQWCLRTLHEVILFEVSAMIGREGSLRTLGLASWSIPALKLEDFELWVKEHPDQHLGAIGLSVVSNWLLNKLADNGQWLGVHVSSRRHLLHKRGKSDLQKLDEFVGKGFATEKGITKNSQIGRLLHHFGGEQALSYWSKPKPWLELIDKGPLKKAISISPQDNCPRLATGRAAIISNPVRYRGTASGIVFSTDPSLELDGQPTGRKNDQWKKTENKLHNYYRALYQRTFAEESRLVRAHEHNGMIGGEIASEVIQRFEQKEINTLVATPTLEMGVDLPDLPVVIHRSVPPDASNYAQRAGRAGRGPKRALVVTHCGFGSHDLNFYEDPPQMVSGEILPPGLPRENLSIIARHVQGLVLEVLTKDLPQMGEPIRLSWWGDLVDMNGLRQDVLRFAGESNDIPECSPIDWRACISRRKAHVQAALTSFLSVIKTGLWSGLPTRRIDDMTRRLVSKGDADAWSQAFHNELLAYYDKAKSMVIDFSSWAQKNRVADKKVESEIQRQYWRAYKIALLYLTKNEQNYPLSYLGSSGFLPNFDFPGKTIRFVGVMPQFAANRQQYVKSDQQFLTFSRGANLALREFAPEQKIYGQGFVYTVDRYESDSKEEDSGKAWGVCTAGCTELTKPGQLACQFCGSALVNSGRDNAGVPKLVEISGVQGVQAAVISDNESKRTFNRMVKEVRHLGIPPHDQKFFAKESPGVTWQIHTSYENQVKTVTMLSGSLLTAKEGKTSFSILPVYKEITESQSRVFKVKATLSENQEDDSIEYEEFLPAIWGKGQSLIFTAPFGTAANFGWIRVDERDVETLECYYKTLAHLISRAASRVLRLNKRKSSLQFLDHQLKEASSHGEPRVTERALLILDADEGGSGVIEVLWDYWDQIMDECERLVLKTCCINGCYECINSYDNQYDHAKIHKSLFYFNEGGMRVSKMFKSIKKFINGQQAISDSGSAQEQPTDKNSPAELALEDFLRRRFPNLRKTQASIEDISGREITRPDFILEMQSKSNLILFVDGWAHHRTKIRTDNIKRNRVAMQGGRIAALPGALLTPNRNDEILEELIRWIKQERSPLPDIQFNESKKIEAKLNPTELQRIHSSLILQQNWNVIDGSQLLESTIRICRSNHLIAKIREVPLKHWPVALQQSYLLWPCYMSELEKPENKRLWENLLLLQAVFAIWGYSNLLVLAEL